MKLLQLSVIFLIGWVRETLGENCKEEEAFLNIKDYFQTPGVAEAIYAYNLGGKIDLRIVWENVLRLDDICASKEREFLRLLCKYDKNLRYPLVSAYLLEKRFPNTNRHFLPAYRLLGERSRKEGNYKLYFCNWLNLNGFLNISLINETEEMESIVTKYLTMPDNTTSVKFYNITADIPPPVLRNPVNNGDTYSSWLVPSLTKMRMDILKQLEDMKVGVMEDIRRTFSQLRTDIKKDLFSEITGAGKNVTVSYL